MKVLVKRVGNHSMPLPRYQTEGASGFDLCARLDAVPGGRIAIAPGAQYVIPAGFAFEVPEGYELQVRPRSGLSAKGLTVMLGTVDSDYRGEVSVLLRNMSDEVALVEHGQRIAQGVIAPVWQADLVEVDTLTETKRGANGFGSTGLGAGEVTP